MPKLILTFSLAVLLAACATLHKTPVITDLDHYKRVDYFQNNDGGAFGVTGTFEDFSMDGVLVVKKMGASDFEVSLLSAGTHFVNIRISVTTSSSGKPNL